VLLAGLLAISFCQVARADFEAGMRHYKAFDQGSAFDEWLPAAKAGHVEAQYWLAQLYYFGKGVKRNYGEAFKWFAKAAASKHPAATYYVGESYRFGYGVKQNNSTAVDWFAKAAVLPDEAAGFFDLDEALYLPQAAIHDLETEYRAITHVQMELIATRIAALNQCFY
jgi:TPR repeat protein